eukprot:Partr_v1_DN28092_c1_g1_i4_m57715 putative Hydroxyacylglutathione hydrolase
MLVQRLILMAADKPPQMKLQVEIIKCLNDNYAYLLVDTATGQAACIDPVEADRVHAQIQTLKLDLKYILTTHHHWDHSSGNKAMSSLYPQAQVVGYDDGRIPALTLGLDDGRELELGQNIRVKALHTPGHTSTSLSYHAQVSGEGGQDVVFTGDTLFVAGCGKFFEGTGKDMLSSLDKLAALADDTLVYCGHEYTASNLKFAAAAEPGNCDIKEAIANLKACTVPSSIGQEKMINPFMRLREESIAKATGVTADGKLSERMSKLRAMKDGWSGQLL